MRVDVYLAQKQYVTSRTRAQQLIAEGKVMLDGETVLRPKQEVDEASEHTVHIAQDDGFVGRGAYKLEAALDAFGIDVARAWALDIGASTGGFTDCLLRRGAARVYAVDAGYGQLADKLVRDERVVNLERCNARYLTADVLGEEFIAHGGADIAVMDVSFISQTYILGALVPLLCDSGRIVSLIKPQFELDKQEVGKGGIVRKQASRRKAVSRVLSGAADVGLVCQGMIVSPIQGGDGNVEYLALWTKAGPNDQSRLTEQKIQGDRCFAADLFE